MLMFYVIDSVVSDIQIVYCNGCDLVVVTDDLCCGLELSLTTRRQGPVSACDVLIIHTHTHEHSPCGLQNTRSHVHSK